MLKVFFIVGIFLFCPVFVRAECPSYDSKIDIRVIKDYGKLVYDHTKSSDEFYKVAGSGFGSHTRGLTIADFNLSVRADASNYTYDDKENCVYLDAVDLEMSYNQILVLIDKRYKKSSCEYKVILDHENKHVAVHKKSLDYYAPYIIGAMEKALYNLEPMPVRSGKKKDVEEAVNTIIDDLMDKISGMLDFFEEERNRANDKLDTQENYEKEHALCRNW